MLFEVLSIKAINIIFFSIMDDYRTLLTRIKTTMIVFHDILFKCAKTKKYI